MIGSAMVALLVGLAQQGADDIAVGHWVVARGHLTKDRFTASRLEVTEAERYDVLIGTVESEDEADQRFTLLGQEVAHSNKTDWADGAEPGSLVGMRIKLEGRWRNPLKFSAREVSPRGPGRDRVEGRVDRIEPASGGVLLSVMHLRIFVPSDLPIEHEGALNEIATVAQRSDFDPQNPQARSFNRARDLDDLFGEGFEIAQGLWVEGQLEARSTSEDDFNLDRTDAEDRVDRNAALRLRLTWVPNDTMDAVTELRYGWRSRDDQDDGRSTVGDADLGEAFLRLHQPLSGGNLQLILGRQDFDDTREWIYDQNLDAVRLRWRRDDLQVEVSHSTTLADGRARDKDSRNWIAHVSNGDRKQQFAAWGIHRRMHVPGAPDDRSLHLGCSWFGDWLPNTETWLDVAHLQGKRAGVPVQAWGYDVGATWLPFGEDWFSLTGGYAFGSGDQNVGRKDHGFRQTGLQDNNARFSGVTSFRYYGELVDPELSNLGITTVGIGCRPSERSSVDLVWHEYLQDKAVATLVDSDLDMNPNGLDADIGRELDLILGWRGGSGWDFELVGALFEPGGAFPGADRAELLKLQLRYRF